MSGDPDEMQEVDRLNRLTRHWVQGHDDDPDRSEECEVCGYLSFALDELEKLEEGS